MAQKINIYMQKKDYKQKTSPNKNLRIKLFLIKQKSLIIL